VGVEPQNQLSKFILPIRKKFGGGKPQIWPTCHQSEACNFKTAQHINKQKYIFIYDKCAKTRYQILGITRRGCDVTW